VHAHAARARTDRLASGNTLITSYTSSSVLEVDPSGKVVLKLTGLKTPNEARRPPNGHTLVGEARITREFDASGTVVRRILTGRVGTVHRY
jgi:hypothetical protein